MNVVILAQGQQYRLRNLLTTPKQLLTVGNEPIIGRTIRLCKEMGLLPVVVAPCADVWRDRVQQPYQVPIHSLSMPGTCSTTGVFQLLPLCAERVLFLLGDVVYSRGALLQIVQRFNDRSVGNNFFAGTLQLTSSTGELFAFSGRRDDFTAPASKCIHFGDAYQCGHLRNMMLPPTAPPEFTYEYLAITDWTNDIDTEDDVLNLLPFLDECVRKDIEL